MKRHTLALLLVLILPPAGLRAGEPRPAELESGGIAAMGEGDYARAEGVFRELIELRPDSFVGHYNLAAALSMQGRAEEAVGAMSEAITIGFTDKAQLLRDPDLANLRETGFFTELMAHWPELIAARREGDIERARQLIRKRLETRADASLRIDLLSSHDPVATDQALGELSLIGGWAKDAVFTDLERIALGDLPWVTVVLPERAGFTDWAVASFGPGVRGSVSSVGGAYEHQQRRLVAQDLGATLRHEFVHVLHWRDMNRLGQVHAPWVQEGLASLVEDYDLAGGKLTPVASWRTNIVKRLLEARRLPTLRELTQVSMRAFTSTRPLAKYAQARTVMLFLLDQGELGEFYAYYCAHQAEDPSGYAALGAVLDLDDDELEERYRAWVRDLPSVPETGADLTATLGIEIENGEGDGVVVRGLPGDARRRTGLRLGSVITHINDRPTRDLLELIRVLGDYGPGQSVTLHVRRGTRHTTTEATLRGR